MRCVTREVYQNTGCGPSKAELVLLVAYRSFPSALSRQGPWSWRLEWAPEATFNSPYFLERSSWIDFLNVYIDFALRVSSLRSFHSETASTAKKCLRIVVLHFGNRSLFFPSLLWWYTEKIVLSTFVFSLIIFHTYDILIWASLARIGWGRGQFSVKCTGLKKLYWSLISDFLTCSDRMGMIDIPYWSLAIIYFCQTRQRSFVDIEKVFLANWHFCLTESMQSSSCSRKSNLFDIFSPRSLETSSLGITLSLKQKVCGVNCFPNVILKLLRGLIEKAWWSAQTSKLCKSCCTDSFSKILLHGATIRRSSQ